VRRSASAATALGQGVVIAGENIRHERPSLQHGMAALLSVL